MISVDELMTRDPYTLRPDDTLEKARGLLTDKHIRHVPVTDADGKLVGLVTQRDLLQATISGADGQLVGANKTLEEIMIREVNVISQTDPVRAAALHLRQHKHGCMPVVEDGRVIGIITDSDFITVAINLLEQADLAEETGDIEPEDIGDIDLPVLDEGN